MEVCKIVEGQRYLNVLNWRQTDALMKTTYQRPLKRERDIMTTVCNNACHEDPYAKEFGIKISENLAQVEARILPPPLLKYHDTGIEKVCRPQAGKWDMINKKVINGGKVNNWFSINFSSNVQDSDARCFCDALAQSCSISGMEFNPEPVVPPVNACPDQVENVLKTCYHEASRKLPRGQELDLLIAILPDNSGFLYGELKRICETDLGLVSQCFSTKKVLKMSKLDISSVALKINVKVGGRNTVLVDAHSLRCVADNVSHPHAGEDSNPSIATVVASQEDFITYASLVSSQLPNQQIIQNLFKEWKNPVTGTVEYGRMIREHVKSFERNTGQMPQRIIFYRDGVGEEAFNQLLEFELVAIRKACASLEPNYQPDVTFVVVQKRHHTRLFAGNHHDKSSVDKSGNILPGTVVDSKICHPTLFDFLPLQPSWSAGYYKPSNSLLCVAG